MKKPSLRGVLLLLLLSGWSASVHAKATWVKKAQAIDPAVKDCLACHTTKKGRELNATRGQFLMDRKNELGVKDVDLEWLRDYKEPEAAASPSVTPTATPTATPAP